MTQPEIRVAQVLGTHALVVFAAALAVMLLLVLAFALVVRRIERKAARTRCFPRRLPPLLPVLAGLAIAVGAGLVFTEMAEALDVREEMGRFDIALAETLRLRLPQAALQVFAWVTRLGDTATLTVLCTVVAGLLLWRGQRRLALAWVFAVAGNGVLNSLLKHLFERARPPHGHGLLVHDGGFSFPSGHSSGSVVAYGMLAYLVLRVVSVRWQLPVLMAATAVACTTGLSRVFLQVHYASDVLAGFASGLLWLTVCLGGLEWLRWREDARSAAGLPDGGACRLPERS